MSKRASYRFGVRWIAENDEPESVDVEEVAGYVSTLLLADLFGGPLRGCARDRARPGAGGSRLWLRDDAGART
jgi:hypothetical protein